MLTFQLIGIAGAALFFLSLVSGRSTAPVR
jgi:hypothetical protein